MKLVRYHTTPTFRRTRKELRVDANWNPNNLRGVSLGAGEKSAKIDVWFGRALEGDGVDNYLLELTEDDASKLIDSLTEALKTAHQMRFDKDRRRLHQIITEDQTRTRN